MTAPISILRYSRRAVTFAAACLMLGCAGEAGSQGQNGFSGERRLPEAAASREGAIVDGTPRGSLDAISLQQRLQLSPRPPEIVATSQADLQDKLLYAERASASGEAFRRGRWVEAAQIGLLFGAPEGKAFLSATEGRALVRGEPVESCPAIHVGAARSDSLATEGAMRACLNRLATRPDCGCKLLARGQHLFAKRDELAYAIGVGTHLIDPASGRDMHFTSEERVVEGRSGARHVWLLAADGPFGLLQIEEDGRAALLVSATGARFDGTHKADGFRRGRIARRAYLSNPEGRRIVVLVGYENSELEDNRLALTAWNPHGSIELKKAEAE